MKKLFTYILLGLLSQYVFSQSVDCSSHRFDQEVFTTVNTASDIVFGSNIDNTGAVTSLTMDIYEPAGDTMVNRPLIVWAHGGSFIGGSKTDVDVVSLSEHFAKRGYVCASITYRMGIYPVNSDNATMAVYRAVQDMKAAVRFFRKDAATANAYKIDPNMIFAGGSSAGAFAALHLAYLNTYAELPAAIDTALLGDIEGNSGNPGYSSTVNAVVDLCGALGDKTYVVPGDIPFVSMHGDADGTVPYASAMIYLLGIYPVMVVDGSYSIAQYANTIGVHNEMYTYYGGGHVPFATNTSYMDTTVRFVSNFLFRYLGCTPSDPTPLENTFINTSINKISDKDAGMIYPNPASNELNIQLKSSSDIFSLYDISGRKLFERTNGGIEFKIDLSRYNPGVYFYSMRTSENIYSGKVMIER